MKTMLTEYLRIITSFVWQMLTKTLAHYEEKYDTHLGRNITESIITLEDKLNDTSTEINQLIFVLDDMKKAPSLKVLKEQLEHFIGLLDQKMKHDTFLAIQDAAVVV